MFVHEVWLISAFTINVRVRLKKFEEKCCQMCNCHGKVQVGKDQEKAQSEKDSHSKNRGGKKPN